MYGIAIITDDDSYDTEIQAIYIYMRPQTRVSEPRANPRDLLNLNAALLRKMGVNSISHHRAIDFAHFHIYIISQSIR